MRPCCFGGRSGSEHGLDYTATKKAWMNIAVIFEWLRRFDAYIAQTPNRKAVLLIDNCSAHGDIELLPTLLRMLVIFLPKNTTSRLQPLDAGVIASIKKRYKRCSVVKAVELIESGVTRNLYDVDVLLATKNIYKFGTRCRLPPSKTVGRRRALCFLGKIKLYSTR